MHVCNEIRCASFPNKTGPLAIAVHESLASGYGVEKFSRSTKSVCVLFIQMCRCKREMNPSPPYEENSNPVNGDCLRCL